MGYVHMSGKREKQTKDRGGMQYTISPPSSALLTHNTIERVKEKKAKIQEGKDGPGSPSKERGSGIRDAGI